MAENLRYGTRIDQNIEQTDNGIVEMYRWSPRKDGDTIGGSYRWQEAMNYRLDSGQGICPPGWHIPTCTEWEELLKGMPMSYSVRFYGKDGLSELNIHISNNILRYMGEIESYQLYYGAFWASDFERTEGLIYPGLLHVSPFGMEVGPHQPQSGPENSAKYVQYLSLRCRKN